MVYSELVLATGSASDAALKTRGADVVEGGQSVALVEIAVLDNFVDGQTGAKFRNSQQFGIGHNLLVGDAADVVPGLAFATGATLFRFKYKLKFYSQFHV